jgi:hypothetical protein
MIIPPFNGVTLVAFQDRLELVATYCYREIVGLGKCKIKDARPLIGEGLLPFFSGVSLDEDEDGNVKKETKEEIENREVWVIVQWRRFDDGQQKSINFEIISSDATEEEARKAFDRHTSFLNMSKKELKDLSQCYEASDEDLDYIKNRFAEIPKSAQAIFYEFLFDWFSYFLIDSIEWFSFLSAVFKV